MSSPILILTVSPVVIKCFYLRYFLFSWEEIQLGYKYLACFEIIWNLSSSALPLSLPFSLPPLVRNPSLCCFTSVLVCWSSAEIFWKYFKFKNISHPAACVQFPAWRSVEISNFFLILNFWTRLSLKLVWNKFEIF